VPLILKFLHRSESILARTWTADMNLRELEGRSEIGFGSADMARCHCYDPVTRINHSQPFTLTAVDYRRRAQGRAGAIC
jgi:fumarylacetoacetate (FAA) hydrolase family protein